MLNLKEKNLSTLAEAGYEFELVVPGEVEGSGAFITVRGAESKIARAQQRKRFKENQAREEKARRTGKELKVELEDLEDLATETAVTRVISWRGIVLDENSGEVMFTPEEATRIFNEHPWIREAVLKESNEIDNFRG